LYIASNIQTFNNQSLPALYVVNFCDGGYVIIPTDDIFYPILAYSFESKFSETGLPPNIQSWLDWYSAQIVEGINNPEYSIRKQHILWNNIRDLAEDIFSNETTVEPLTTSKWDQMDFYNELCPDDTEGFDGHSPVGCVAIAMAQLMFYYRFPPVGNGSYTYIPQWENGIYGEQFANFGNTWYRWNEMQDQCFESNPAVAELCYHCGVAVNMEYQTSNAGAQSSDAVDAFINYFNYHPSAYYQIRTELGSTAQWMALLMESLDKRQPVLYRSTNGWGGHAYVCDGYQDSLHFHFNWGWSGNYNGYYYIDELIPGGINLNYDQAAIFNIYPDSTQFEYPYYCEGPEVLTSKFGTIEDGSGPEDYLSNTSCSWLIQPADTSLTDVLIDLSLLDTESGKDIISIYKGSFTGAELLGEYSGNEIPETIHSSSDTVLVTFQSDSETEFNGWKLSYYAYRLPFCDEIMEVNDKDGIISDGSMHLHYAPNTNCSWLIAPQVPVSDSVDRIRLHFDLFSVAPDDTLFVYDGDSETMPLLGKFSGWVQPEEVFSSTNRVFVQFNTNGGYNGPGWEISYFSVNPDYCMDTVWFTSPDGLIEDGSGTKNYVENTDCYWLIDVPNAEFIVLDFIEVDLEEFYDNVKVYDLNNPLQYIERITGHEPYQPFTVFSNRILLNFTTDDRDNFSGWKMEYHASVEGIENLDAGIVEIYPNPFSHQINITSYGAPFNRAGYELINLCGELIHKGVLNSHNEILSVENLNAGIYILKINNGDRSVCKKIMKY